MRKKETEPPVSARVFEVLSREVYIIFRPRLLAHFGKPLNILTATTVLKLAYIHILYLLVGGIDQKVRQLIYSGVCKQFYYYITGESFPFSRPRV